MIRGATRGQQDSLRTNIRNELTKVLTRSLAETLGAITQERASRVLDVTPHLATDNLERFQVVLDVKTPVPFQVKYLVKEPSGAVLSGIMMGPARLDPADKSKLRFPAETLKALNPGNNVYVLSGEIAHLPSEERPVPQFYPFEVRYRSAGKELLEISRQQPPAH